MTLLTYSNTFHLGLTVDARAIITNDTRIRTVGEQTLGQILHHDYWWPISGDRLYRPVTLISYMFDYAVLGDGQNPIGYHWTNYFLHAINVLLVFELALLLFRCREPAFWAAGLWAVHPIHTEAVTYIAGRADLLAGMFVLGGALLYARASAWQGRKLLAAAAGLFAIATLGEFSKENAAVLIGLMVLWDLSFGKTEGAGWRRRLPLYAGVAAALALLLWMRARIFDAIPWPETPFVANPLIGAGFWEARLTAIKVIGLDLWLLLFPLHLSSDRSYRQIPVSGWGDPAVWLALAVIVAVLAAVVVRRRRDPVIFWSAGFTGLLLLPSSNLLFPIGTIMAERVLYLPCLGFVVALVALLSRLERPRAVRIALAVVMVLWMGRTLLRNPAWSSDLDVAMADVQTAPESFGLHQRLASALYEQDPQRNLDQAIREGETAWGILSDLPPARRYQQTAANLGAFYRAKGDSLGGPDTPQGRQSYEKALAILLQGRETARAVEKSYDEAQLAHGKPLARRVAFRDVYFNLGAVYALLGKNSDALEAYRYGRILDPGSADPYEEMAAVYRASGNLEWAAIMLHEKAQLEGYLPPTLEALTKLYGAMPDASCALSSQDGGVNFQCARVQNDVCRAVADLAQAFDDARIPERAIELRKTGAQRYGCAPP